MAVYFFFHIILVTNILQTRTRFNLYSTSSKIMKHVHRTHQTCTILNIEHVLTYTVRGRKFVK